MLAALDIAALASLETAIPSGNCKETEFQMRCALGKGTVVTGLRDSTESYLAFLFAQGAIYGVTLPYVVVRLWTPSPTMISEQLA